MSRMTLQNANKVAYLIQQYPEKNVDEVIKMLTLPSIDINAGLWLAIELGWISEPDPEEKAVRFLKAAESWDFGDEVNHLVDTIVYCFEKLNGREEDLEETYVSNWLRGYAPHDILIAIKRLLENKQLAEYKIKDGENEYAFYTLYENRKKLWGRKQFKKDPLKKSKS